MDKDYELSGSEEMDRRKDKAVEFFGVILNADERPYFVSDEATLFDIIVGEEGQVIRRCEMHYGVKIGASEFEIPVWQLLDYLEARRLR